MDVFALRFVKASLIYGLGGVLGGLAMVAWPDTRQLLVFAHAHWLLFGFVGMLIFGVAYHVLPRFRGRPLHSPRLAHWHVWLANIGLLGLSGFWVIEGVWAGRAATAGLQLSAIVAVVSFAVFVYNMWRTIY